MEHKNNFHRQHILKPLHNPYLLFSDKSTNSNLAINKPIKIIHKTVNSEGSSTLSLNTNTSFTIKPSNILIIFDIWSVHIDNILKELGNEKKKSVSDSWI